MRIAMIGTGYVGLVSGACFADFGHQVTCVDKDAEKIAALRRGEIPIFEPGLDELVSMNVKGKRLDFSTDLKAPVAEADAVFIAVGTPSRRGDGHADLSYVYAAAREIAGALSGFTVVVTKSTVPVGTGAMAAILGLEAALVAQACEEAAQGEVVSPANMNGAGQVVIAGSKDAVARASERAKALGAKRAIPLPVSAPFHCALMKPAEERLAPELRALATRQPVVPIVANVDAEPKRSAADCIEALVAQVSSPVRWEDVVRRLASDGVTTYVEIGPGTVLSGLARKIHRDATVLNVGSPDDVAAVEGLRS